MTRKMKIMLGILASAALVALAGTGLYLRFGLQVLDRPGMENPAGPMLELLNADWMSDDGVWSARIEGETLDLSYRQELVYSGGFSFDFQGDGLNAKTELSFDDKQFESEDGSVSSTMESLSVENRKLYLVITVSKAGEASVRQQMVLNRAESGKTTEGESEKIREVSDMAELMEFSWHQSAMSFSDRQSFSPKRYAYSYDFYIVIHVNNPYFNEIRFKLNSSKVDNDEETLLDSPTAMPRSRSGVSRPTPGAARPGAVRPGAVPPGGRPMPGRAPMGGGMMGGARVSNADEVRASLEYQQYEQMGQEIREALLQVRQEARDTAAAANAPKTAVTCPYCGATTTPDASGCCEFCGGAIGG